MVKGGWTAGPWHACKNGECSCKMVWSLPGDFPVFTGRSDVDTKRYVGEAHTLMADEYPDMVYAEIPELEARANANLIAAAPELYEALEYMADLFKDRAGDQSTEDGWYSEECRDVWLQARAALAKAQGGQR